MRTPNENNYYFYFGQMYGYYEVNKISVPEWLKLECKYYSLINEIPKELYETSSINDVSKYVWDYIKELKASPIIKDMHITDEMYEEAVYTRDLLIRMYDDLLSDKEKNLCSKNPYSLTRSGRRVIRSYLDELRKRNNYCWTKSLNPRKNFLSDMPYGFMFRDTSDDFSYSISITIRSNFILSISFSVNRRCKWFDFKKEFLDEYLRFNESDYMKHSDDYSVKDNKKLDEMRYVYVYRFDDSNHVIVDLQKNTQSVEIKLLKLLKKYYGQELEKQGINIPWFDVIR